MFAFIRHAGYHFVSGSLTESGCETVRHLARALQEDHYPWRGVYTSPTTRTHETALLLGQTLLVPVELDPRLGMDGDYVDLLPPTEPHDLIFVSHLPVMTKILRAWTNVFGFEEVPCTEIGCGYLVDPAARRIVGVPSKR